MAQQPTQPIAENVWWVLPGKLAGVRQPTTAEISELAAAGVSAIVSVFHEADNLERYQQADIPALWLPIAIDSVPNPSQLQAFRDFVAQQTQLGHAVAVHCSTGRHRTGTMLAAYLIGAGASYERAMQTILATNPQLELPTAQTLFLQALANESDKVDDSLPIAMKAAQAEKTIEQPIADNLWWVMPGKLGGVRKPIAEELLELQAAGIGAIVSVLDDSSNLALYEQANIPNLWLPTKGGTAPSQEQIQALQAFVDQQNRLGNGVAVHCTNGIRRTGTMLAAYLIQTGLSYDEAMQNIQSANPDVALREAQTTFLKALAGELSGDIV